MLKKSNIRAAVKAAKKQFFFEKDAEGGGLSLTDMPGYFGLYIPAGNAETAVQMLEECGAALTPRVGLSKLLHDYIHAKDLETVTDSGVRVETSTGTMAYLTGEKFITAVNTCYLSLLDANLMLSSGAYTPLILAGDGMFAVVLPVRRKGSPYDRRILDLADLVRREGAC